MNYVTTWALFKQKKKIAAHKINFKNDKIIVWLLQQVFDSPGQKFNGKRTGCIRFRYSSTLHSTCLATA